METLDAGGHRLEFRTIPAMRAEAPPLVFLHEGLGSAALWREFPDRVAAATGSAALVYSRYGHGGSDVLAAPRESDYLHREAGTLREILAAFGIEAPVLVGHSDGASIALIHAAADPDLAGIVLMAPHVFVEDMTVAGIEAAVAAFRAGPLRHRLAPHHADIDRTFFGWADAWLAPEFRRWDITALLPLVACDVLLIQGGDDAYGTAAQLEAIARAVRGRVETLLLPATGHAPHRERQDETLAAIAAFVGGR